MGAVGTVAAWLALGTYGPKDVGEDQSWLALNISGGSVMVDAYSGEVVGVVMNGIEYPPNLQGKYHEAAMFSVIREDDTRVPGWLNPLVRFDCEPMLLGGRNVTVTTSSKAVLRGERVLRSMGNVPWGYVFIGDGVFIHGVHAGKMVSCLVGAAAIGALADGRGALWAEGSPAPGGGLWLSWVSARDGGSMCGVRGRAGRGYGGAG